ncbi:MAG: twin-arginine translocation pathway signal, partial [Rhodopila sp.]|nr:twin-arginine translocation pathway signal [Rhodopila sp.]
MILSRRRLIAGLAAFAPITPVLAATSQIDSQADRAAAASLRKLIAGSPVARELNERATAVLVFPKIVKVGFVLGGAYGEGVLRQGDQTVGYYNSAAASYGLQAGAQW